MADDEAETAESEGEKTAEGEEMAKDEETTA